MLMSGAYRLNISSVCEAKMDIISTVFSVAQGVLGGQAAFPATGSIKEKDCVEDSLRSLYSLTKPG